MLMLKAVQLDPRYVPALLTYGVLLCQLARFGTRFSLLVQKHKYWRGRRC